MPKIKADPEGVLAVIAAKKEAIARPEVILIGSTPAQALLVMKALAHLSRGVAHQSSAG